MIKTSTHDGITTIAFDRPETLNALTRELGEQALCALRDAAASGAKAVVLTGTGRAFSAGADLVGFSAVGAQGGEALAQSVGRDMREAMNPLSEAIADSPIPVISAVNGPCVGGGVGIALAADVAIAARSAYFLLPQVTQLGIVPDLGATWALPRKLGRARALGASLLGERIDAERAEAWGLIWKCVDDAALMDEAMAIARQLARSPSAAVRATRALIDAAPSATLHTQLEQERLCQVEFVGSAFFREAVARFVTVSSNLGR
ncbi:enoyl-CoA hydratase-related protein [Ramlibacter sp. 2FC]|uniref:enoyl-CoA hydratase-related protein n=1 Tax=Ramlibacter sp. 2FC TaxID=2502188 RepID=UPI001484DE5C|nr:enoyl-CoA hydratase-related protein [Ramlibacter sp. 2FC]